MPTLKEIGSLEIMLQLAKQTQLEQLLFN